ncbi:hypothetical protein D3C80_1871510 [compost metagenome]
MGVYGSAKIIETNKGGYRRSVSFTYSFFVEGREIIGHGGFPDLKEECRHEFINKYFPVIYQSDQPSNNRLLITRQSFKNFGIGCPDSLLWVDDYMEGKIFDF